MEIIAAVTRSPQERTVLETSKLVDAFDEELHVVNVLKLGEFVEVESGALESTGNPRRMDEIRDLAKRHAAAEGVVEEFVPVGLVGEPSTEMIIPTMSRLFWKTSGPGWIPWSTNAPRMTTIARLPGIPNPRAER